MRDGGGGADEVVAVGGGGAGRGGMGEGGGGGGEGLEGGRGGGRLGAAIAVMVTLVAGSQAALFRKKTCPPLIIDGAARAEGASQ